MSTKNGVFSFQKVDKRNNHIMWGVAETGCPHEPTSVCGPWSCPDDVHFLHLKLCECPKAFEKPPLFPSEAFIVARHGWSLAKKYRDVINWERWKRNFWPWSLKREDVGTMDWEASNTVAVETNYNEHWTAGDFTFFVYLKRFFIYSQNFLPNLMEKSIRIF